MLDLRVLLVIPDRDVADAVLAQVQILGCVGVVAGTYNGASSDLAWADAVVIDLAGDGLDDLYRLRVEAPTVRVLALAPDDERVEAARETGAHQVLLAPFAAMEVGMALRALGRGRETAVVDLRLEERAAAASANDA